MFGAIKLHIIVTLLLPALTLPYCDKEMTVISLDNQDIMEESPDSLVEVVQTQMIALVYTIPTIIKVSDSSANEHL